MLSIVSRDDLWKSLQFHSNLNCYTSAQPSHHPSCHTRASPTIHSSHCRYSTLFDPMHWPQGQSQVSSPSPPLAVWGKYHAPVPWRYDAWDGWWIRQFCCACVWRGWQQLRQLCVYWCESRVLGVGSIFQRLCVLTSWLFLYGLPEMLKRVKQGGERQSFYKFCRTIYQDSIAGLFGSKTRIEPYPLVMCATTWAPWWWMRDCKSEDLTKPQWSSSRAFEHHVT